MSENGLPSGFTPPLSSGGNTYCLRLPTQPAVVKALVKPFHHGAWPIQRYTGFGGEVSEVKSVHGNPLVYAPISFQRTARTNLFPIPATINMTLEPGVSLVAPRMIPPVWDIPPLRFLLNSS